MQPLPPILAFPLIHIIIIERINHPRQKSTFYCCFPTIQHILEQSNTRAEFQHSFQRKCQCVGVQSLANIKILQSELNMNYYQMGAQQLTEAYKSHSQQRPRILNLTADLTKLLVSMQNQIQTSKKKKGMLSTAFQWVTTPITRKRGTQDPFEEAFSSLDVFEKIIYYVSLIDWLNGTSTRLLQPKFIQFVGEFKTQSLFQNWSPCVLQAELQKLQVRLNNMPVNMQFYLVRKSNSTGRLIIVFQSFRQDLTNYRFGLYSNPEFEQCFKILNYIMESSHRKSYAKMLNIQQPVRKDTPTKPKNQHLLSGYTENSAKIFTPPKVMGTGDIRDIQNQVSAIQPKSISGLGYDSLDIFNRLMPGYNLSALTSQDLSEFRALRHEPRYILYQSLTNPKLLRFAILVRYPKQIVTQVLSQPRQVEWNREVQQSYIKQRYPDDNYGVIYHKLRSKPPQIPTREFVFLRHVFSLSNTNYIIDKSVTDTTPHQQNIIRGQIKYRLIWVSPANTESQCLINILADIQHNVSTSPDKEAELTCKYLLQLLDIETYLQHFQSSNHPHFDFPNDQTFHLSFSSGIQNHSSLKQSNESEQSYYTAQGKNGWQGNTFSSKITSKNQTSNLQSKNTPQPSPRTPINQPRQPTQYYQSVYNTHIQPNGIRNLWKDSWEIHPDGLVCVEVAKLKKQNNFYKYVLPKLTSSSDIMNIQMPIDICGEFTLLQMMAKSLCLAPLLLQKATLCNDPIDRFKFSVAFGLSTCMLSIQVDKPLIPIQGQTYQGWINGNPVYVQQLSINPPVTSVFMVGKGYCVYGTHTHIEELNSDQISYFKQGEYIVQFEKPLQRFHIRVPQAQIKGLISGDRTFKYKQFGYFYQQRNSLYCEIQFKPNIFRRAFSHKLIDTLQGSIVVTSREFITKFMTSKRKLKLDLNYTREISQISGRWTQGIAFDSLEYYNVLRDLPSPLIHQPHPLPSDSNLREDLKQIKQKNLTQAYIERQHLQLIQRSDFKRRKSK